MTAHDLEAIRKRAEAPNLPAGPWTSCARGAESPDVKCTDERFGTLLMLFWPAHPIGETEWAEDAIYSAAEFIAASRTDVPALCDEVERLTKDRDHWQANHDEQVRKNFALTYRTDLDVGKVRDRVELVAAYDALKVEVERLREQIKEEVECPACEGSGRDGYTGTDADQCQMCDTAGRIDSKRVREMWTAEIARYTRAEVENERLVAENAKLREVAERVKAEFAPFHETVNIYNGDNDPKEVPVGELLCGGCGVGLDEHDPDCLYALADLALRGGKPTRSET